MTFALEARPLGLGAFRQVAPVIRHGSDPTATSSDLWERFEVLCLTAPIRYAGDPAYADWVDRVGDVPPYMRPLSTLGILPTCAPGFSEPVQ
jgi:hypothetical protein